MNHLTPDQFVDLAEGTQPEASQPHLASCEPCRRQLADVRAMMSAAAAGADGAGNNVVPEPSPLFWDHLSARVREAVDAEHARPQSWREHLLRPWVILPSLAAAMALVLAVVLWPGAPVATVIPSTIPSTPLPISGDTAAMLLSLPPLAPLGAADDPQLGLVADYGATLDWDEMRDEVALATPGGSSAAVVDALTIDEQRELQRLLAEEMAQPSALEIRS